MVPLGVEKNKYEIDQFEIINNGTCPVRPEYGNYDYRSSTGHTIKNIIKHFERNRGVRSLIKNVLLNLKEVQ